MKSHLIGLVILLLILTNLVSAEMVTLQNCVIDTGAYILPGDLGTGKYRLIDPLHIDSDGVLAEGIYWVSDNSASGIKIYELSSQKTINYTIQQSE
jgi:hypothetical protein